VTAAPAPRSPLALLGVAFLGACAPVGVPTAPGPVPAPSMRVAVDDIAEGEEVAIDAPVLGPRDEILHSATALEPDFDREVDGWVGYWTQTRPDWFVTYLDRMTAYEAFVDSVVTARGLPRSLRFLPIIESGYTTGAVSHASAVGMWQLMAPTARELGLRVGRMVDERRDPVRATDVALTYLDELHRRFGSWYLALAAYNGGPSRVERAIERIAPGVPLADSVYLLIRPWLPRETQDFVPRFLAAARIAEAPRAFDLRPGEGQRLLFDRVSVPDAASLDVVARAAGVTEGEVVALNPHVLRGVTAVGVPTEIRLPVGSGARFRVEFPKIPEDERVSVAEHVVASGDTLWDIARSYGVALDTLREANPSVRPERMQPGDRLLIPLLPDGDGGGG